MMTPTTRMAAVALPMPYLRVMAAPIASSARKEMAPSAVLATRAADHRRALLAVNRSA
jgi:hypothetical protein